MTKKINVTHSTINVLSPFLYIALIMLTTPLAGYIGTSIFRLSCTIIPGFGNTDMCYNPVPFSAYYVFFEMAVFILPVWLLFLYFWFKVLNKFKKFLKENIGGVLIDSKQVFLRLFIIAVFLLFIPLSMLIIYFIDEKINLFGITPFYFPVTPIDFMAIVPIWIILSFIFLFILKIIIQGKRK